MVNSLRSGITDPGIRDALRLKSALLGRPLIGPKTVNIHVINSCNHQCEFCWYFSVLVKSHPRRRMLDYPVLERVLEDCREIGVDEINLEGGEVTLYPFWKEAFRRVKKLGMRLIAYTHLDFGPDRLAVLCRARSPSPHPETNQARTNSASASVWCQFCGPAWAWSTPCSS